MIGDEPLAIRRAARESVPPHITDAGARHTASPVGAMSIGATDIRSAIIRCDEARSATLTIGFKYQGRGAIQSCNRDNLVADTIDYAGAYVASDARRSRAYEHL